MFEWGLRVIEHPHENLQPRCHSSQMSLYLWVVSVLWLITVRGLCVRAPALSSTFRSRISLSKNCVFKKKKDVLILFTMVKIKCLVTCCLLAEWKHDDLVQRGIRELGGSGEHPVLHQLHSEAARVSHLRGWLSRPGCRRPEKGPFWSVSTASERFLNHIAECWCDYFNGPSHELYIVVAA